MPSPKTGGCRCGRIRFAATGAPLSVGVCHCMDCRKHHGAVFYAAAVFPPDQVTISGKSRAHLGRHFCILCGSCVYALSGFDFELHLGAFDVPRQFRPTYELWTLHREEWVSAVVGAQQFLRGKS